MHIAQSDSGPLIKQGDSTEQKRLLPLAFLPIIASIAGFLSYWGSSLRPALVPNPIISALVVSASVFLLLLHSKLQTFTTDPRGAPPPPPPPPPRRG